MSDEKILSEEKLSDEELEEVAGGAKWETDEIISMYKQAISKDPVNNNFKDIDDFLARAGIVAKMNNAVDEKVPGYSNCWKVAASNEYYLDGYTEKYCIHSEAVHRLKKVYGI